MSEDPEEGRNLLAPDGAPNQRPLGASLFVESDSDKLVLDADPLPEDVYGATMQSLIRDSQKVANGQGACCLRSARILSNLVLLIGIIVIQVFLVFETKKNITAKAVKEERELYSAFEYIMYSGHVVKVASGFYRGEDASYFDASQFYNDSAWKAAGFDPHDARDTTCQVPFSQPYFFGAVLLLWAFTSLLQVASTLRLMAIFSNVKTIPSIADAVVIPDPESPKELVITGLPVYMKASLGLILLMQCFVTLLLLWLGCRWLAATIDFDDLVLNAVALEFVLLLKESAFLFLVSDRSKREVRSTRIPPLSEHDTISWTALFGRMFWLVISVAWVALYIVKVQQVLPDYRWDIHDVCSVYIQEHYKLHNLEDGN
mmetsp:Transcript_44981/g.82181  ORF Transcript_44981/g.82181 Transcript_44981/m.82181 type:complete len:373 (+) Transcript_44981:112-1230(+)